MLATSRAEHAHMTSATVNERRFAGNGRRPLSTITLHGTRQHVPARRSFSPEPPVVFERVAAVRPVDHRNDVGFVRDAATEGRRQMHVFVAVIRRDSGLTVSHLQQNERPPPNAIALGVAGCRVKECVCAHVLPQPYYLNLLGPQL